MRSDVRFVGERARRDAEELSRVLEKRREDETVDLELLRGRSAELAASIDSDWASVVLLAVWNSLREPTEPARPHVKRALELLQRMPDSGSSRALVDLANLVSACWLSHEADMTELAPIWQSSDPDQAVTILISGASLPTTIDARSLMSDVAGSIRAIAEILSLQSDPGEMFSAGDFPHLSRLPASGEARPIWLALYLRMSLIIRLAPFEPGIASLSEQFSTQLYSETGESIVLGYAEITSLLISLEDEVASYPVISSAGACWTSCYLLADSLAPWLLAAIQQTTLREHVISQPFEDKVVSLLRSHGFRAGSVDANGTWTTQSGKERLHCDEKNPGQIDVLATRDDGVFVLECKSIFSMGRIRNIAEKLGLDSHSWRTTLGKKREWVEKALRRDADLSLVVVEGIQAYTSEQEWKGESPLITFETLSQLLDAAAQQSDGPPVA
ncbi:MULTISPECIES: hypothetical protein [unclassified Microbacterium]|uniref:hypothetical protein n=1 Tax=unclassified Microbacterium TaxID=2609290 RepID=UPI0021A2CF39|nr:MULTISPECIES: hypothetical protein [unclassified Microbacterium]MCT1363812.1 hypothetical protein [Microbacterium sp. p3-SID131]MCT1375388.1 hypothetical protein [Microbacterium sp. p3-SID337]